MEIESFTADISASSDTQSSSTSPKTDSALIVFAKKEFAVMANNHKKNHSDETDPADSEMQSLIEKEILELLQVFDNQGHSGFSGNYVLDKFMRLVNFKPITPIMGEDDEWMDCGFDDVQQNRRCFGVFRNKGDNSTARYIHTYAVSDDGGYTWMSCGKSIEKLGYSSHIEFPFTVPMYPKKVYIKHTEPELPGEFNPDDIVDITNDPVAIKELYDRKKAERDSRK